MFQQLLDKIAFVEILNEKIDWFLFKLTKVEIIDQKHIYHIN
jgi:hypothetical protein